jgi:hypothetical protein
MGYPQLRQKIEVLNRKYKIEPSLISQFICRDKTTAWRWLYQKTERLSQSEQELLVKAICVVLKCPEINPEIFENNNILAFCLKAGLSKLEAATFCGLNLPIPEIFLDGLFDLTNEIGRYTGTYLLFRRDRDGDRKEYPYIQACDRISARNSDILVYEDYWEGEADPRKMYQGYVYCVGSLINIIGQSFGREKAWWPEIWWCGLSIHNVASNGKIETFHGYLSDVTLSGTLFTDRVVLVRVAEEEWIRVLEQKEHYISRERVVSMAGRGLADYLDEWITMPIAGPRNRSTAPKL